MINSLNFDISFYEKSKFYDETYYFLNDYSGESRFILSLLRRKNINPKKASLLELGCGTGNLILHLPQIKEICGVDISKKMIGEAIEKNIKNAKFLVKDLTKLKFDKKKFDIIYISTYLIQTFPSKNKLKEFFKKIKYWLKSSGIILFTWIDEKEYKKIYNNGKFNFEINKSWIVYGETKTLSGKRLFKLKFVNTKNNKSIKSKAYYLYFTEEKIKKIVGELNMKSSFYQGKNTGLKEMYQKWGVLEF